MHKKLTFACLFLFIACLLIPVYGRTASSPVINIAGAVKQQLNVSLKELAGFASVTVRLNEVTRDKEFHGVFYYQGVPLRTLLELAGIQKKKPDFRSAILRSSMNRGCHLAEPSRLDLRIR